MPITGKNCKCKHCKEGKKQAGYGDDSSSSDNNDDKQADDNKAQMPDEGFELDGQNESEKVPDGETVQIKKGRLLRRESSKAPTEIDSE